VNFGKSGLGLLRLHVYLGMEVDLAAGIFRVPQEKRDKLLLLLRSLSLAPGGRVHVRVLASAKGQLVAMGWAFGLASQFFTKAMDADIARAPSWAADVVLSDQTLQEIRFWSAQFDAFNGIRPMWPATSVDLVVHVDAAGRSLESGGGWGRVVPSGGRPAGGPWRVGIRRGIRPILLGPGAAGVP
jgi:hypothetical protein